MTEEEYLAGLATELPRYSMAELRRVWRQNRRDWVEAMRAFNTRDARFWSRVKWELLMPEFERRGKTP